MKILLPIVIVAIGGVGATVLVAARAKVETKPPSLTAPLVRVRTVTPTTVQLDVWGQGTVQPRTESNLVAEVDGRALWVSPDLVSGGFFEEGDPLIRMDTTDYELHVARTAATVESSASRLSLARKTLARNQTLAKTGAISKLELDDAENNARVAEAVQREADAAYQQARRNLDRTEIRAPFDGRVRSENIDVGQFLSKGAAIAKVYAVDFAEVRLPLADADLAFLDLDLANRRDKSAESGPAVELSAKFAGQDRQWTGHVTRTEGEIDQRSRMVHVIVRVEDPYGAAVDDGGAPLAVGLFVNATIAGRELPGAIVLPRAAMRGADRVLVVDAEDRLAERKVEVARKLRDEVILSSGLEAGDRVLLSTIEGATSGMKVRVVEDAA
ncbi:MAG: efflux RND transporter periplasmic adaptor subunit [Candidatus Binatia bacterium]|nr:efflux RND transporter periplasmic adaptor subunit [Candidatus Binatia bacterium]